MQPSFQESAPAYAGQRIAAFRKRYGLTQKRLAELLGVSVALVSFWETGRSAPSRKIWAHLERAEESGLSTLRETGERAMEIAESQSEYGTTPVDAPQPDFGANAEAVRAVVEAERFSYGHLFNPAFATEVSLVDPLPHQRIAVYQHMLPQRRLRFLLADDAGAGKTIMTGLYLREMLMRRLIRRILIVPPAGLVGNWEREMRTLFSLSFKIAAGGDAKQSNPFCGTDSDLVIVSIDTLAADRMFGRLQDATIEPYDIVVFDEAHKLSARREPDHGMHKSERYKLAEALAGISTGEERWTLPWPPHHLLLLTATPHMGKEFPYFALWRLLEPEILPTIDAFNNYPAPARQRHFIRRTKEEMVRFDGTRIYPMRVSDTLSYDLSQGAESEQELYDQTTDYMQSYYNQPLILNRSAARLAMSVFQRRLASSTYALLRSFERRLERLSEIIDDIRSGRLDEEQLRAMQRKLDSTPDILDETTADEEEAEDGEEAHEANERQALGGVVYYTLGELEAERKRVEELLALAKAVHENGEESKFNKLLEVLRDARFKNEKIIIFTEHRDTLMYLVRRFEGIGFVDKTAQIHGGMHYTVREEHVEMFRKSADEGGAQYLVCTDAAGEGINLQFCWLMVNYDIPWNPARLEQRMGRIHRYKQTHDPVIIVNLVAGKTREGRVLHILLEKLETIRKELGSDKVFDVIGRLFEGISLREYMVKALTGADADAGVMKIEGMLTKEQVEALEERERRLFGDGGDVMRMLPQEQERMKIEELRRLMPGYVRRFIEKSAPLLDIGTDGDLDDVFSLCPAKPYALDRLLPYMEAYPEAQQNRFSLLKNIADVKNAVFLRPGERLFEQYRCLFLSRFRREALRGGVFLDPYASEPCFFHVAVVGCFRAADPGFASLAKDEHLECRLVGLRQSSDGSTSLVPVEQLMLLRPAAGIPVSAISLTRKSSDLPAIAAAFAHDSVALEIAGSRRKALEDSLTERINFIRCGFDYQDAELAAARSRLSEKAQAGDAKARGDISKIKERQRALNIRRGAAIAAMRREIDLIHPTETRFLAHALVVPSSDPEDAKRHDAEVEAIAVRVAWGHEEARGATVRDVSKPELARAAGLGESIGFDLHSLHPKGEERCIEVKGRAGIGEVELSENEWAKACNLREHYWLYVVYNCGTSEPMLYRVRDPFQQLIVSRMGGVLIDKNVILAAAEQTR